MPQLKILKFKDKDMVFQASGFWFGFSVGGAKLTAKGGKQTSLGLCPIIIIKIKRAGAIIKSSPVLMVGKVCGVHFVNTLNVLA